MTGRAAPGLLSAHLQGGPFQIQTLCRLCPGIDPAGKPGKEAAAAGAEALADFIGEIGLPAALREPGVDESTDLGAMGASGNAAPAAMGRRAVLPSKRFSGYFFNREKFFRKNPLT